MLDRAAGDRASELGDLLGDGTRIGLVETLAERDSPTRSRSA